MQISQNKVVGIDYTLTNDQGQVLDSSQGRAPLLYIHGQGNIIPGLESALEGKSVGAELKVDVPATEGYGEKDASLVQEVPISRFDPATPPTAGMQFQVRTEEGVRSMMVTKVDGDQVTVDFNHPLAGEDLHFAVKVVEVRDASAEELSHGHVHGPGGHQH